MSKLIVNKEEEIVSKIYFIRGYKVMLDYNLAEMYEVETKALKQAVRRNIDRFPDDFMFELTSAEANILKDSIRSQNVTFNLFNFTHLPFVFTEQGIAMLSSVLKSKKALQVNIAIMRTFVQVRKLIDTNKDLAHKIEELEEKYDQQFRVVFDAIKQLIHQKNILMKKVGYKK